MALEWIKFELHTSNKPEVWDIAGKLGIDPDAVVGKLLRVWGWFSNQTTDGNAPSVTKALLDRDCGVKGFCKAIIEAGWMIEKDGMISLPNFDRHNSQTAKTRALTAKRNAKLRTGRNASDASSDARSDARSVTNASPRIDKIREELPPTTHVCEDIQKSDFEPWLVSIWGKWSAYRFQKTGQNITDVEEDLLKLDLLRMGQEKAVRNVEFSIKRGFKTIRDADDDWDRRDRPSGLSGPSSAFSSETMGQKMKRVLANE
jgi:hypothetical protein